MKIQQLLRDNAGRAKPTSGLVRNEANTEATLYIYDVIDAYWGISASSVIESLASVADVPVLHLRINSPGGDVFEGRAIVEAIKRFSGKTIAHIDSLAASAATSIAIAADEVEIAKGAFFMIHNAAAWVYGEKKDMLKTAELLEKVEATIITDYNTKTGKGDAVLAAWMDAETWFTADEAIANGFCDRLATTADKTAQNTWNLAAYSKAPQALNAASAQPAEPTKPIKSNTTGTGQTNTNRLTLETLL